VFCRWNGAGKYRGSASVTVAFPAYRLLLVTGNHAGNTLVQAGEEKNARRSLSIPRKIHM
jgi:hypothetical protein